MTSYTRTPKGNISVVADGRHVLVPADHPRYKEIEAAVKAGDHLTVMRLADIPFAVSEYTSGRVTVKGGVVALDGREVTAKLAATVLEHMRSGLPCDYLCRFIERLYNNPSRRAVNELFDFLRHGDLPITDQGMVMSYKTVRDDWKDWHTGTVDNSVGAKVRMPRNEVDEDSDHECSYGFHTGTHEYVRTFHAGQGRRIIVLWDPADVVAVPKYDTTKIRVCAYEVLAEAFFAMNKSLVYSSETVTPVTAEEERIAEIVEDNEDEGEEAYEEEEYEEEEYEDESDPEDDDEELNPADQVYGYRYVTVACPRCKSDFTNGNSVEVEITIAGAAVTTLSNIDRFTGDLYDTEDMAIANGYHSETRCRKCRLVLTPWEQLYENGEMTYGPNSLEAVDADFEPLPPPPPPAYAPTPEQLAAAPKGKFASFFERFRKKG